MKKTSIYRIVKEKSNDENESLLFANELWKKAMSERSQHSLRKKCFESKYDIVFDKNIRLDSLLNKNNSNVINK